MFVCQYHMSVSLYNHFCTHIIDKLLRGWFVCTIFITHSWWRIAKLTRSLRSLVCLTILHNSWRSYALTNHEVISIDYIINHDFFCVSWCYVLRWKSYFGFTLSFQPHRATVKICLTTAGMIPTTFGMFTQCSANWATVLGQDEP